MIEGLSIGVLSWKAHCTLRKTLQSYSRARLAENASEIRIFFNAITDEDRALAAEFGIACEGSAENLGIWGGMDACAESLSGDMILLLQNDCPVVSTPDETARILEEGVALIRSGKADMIRLRHRFNQGEGISYRRFFDYHRVRSLDPRAVEFGDVGVPANAQEDTFLRFLRRTLRPSAARKRLAAAVHLERDPEKALPGYISKTGGFYVVDSAVAQFSEQPLLISKGLYKKLSGWGRAHLRSGRLNGFPVLEQSLRSSYWFEGGFKVGFCDTGIFTHNRFDDSFRPGHAAFNRDISGGGA